MIHYLTGIAGLLGGSVAENISQIVPPPFQSVLSNPFMYLEIALGLALTIFIAAFLRFWLRRGLKPKVPLHVYNVIEKLLVYTIIIVGAIVSLSPLGISLTGLLVAGGFLGIVIGLAVQTVASNLFSGIFLYVERPFKIGDAVKVMDYGGIIEDISIMSTKIRLWDGVLVRIPNDKLFTSEIINYGKGIARRISFKVGISYKSDIEAARKALLKMMEEHPMILVNPPPQVYVVDYADSAIILEVRGWAPTSEWYPTYMDLLRETKDRLEKAGVEIPFPQLDLHVKEEVNLRLKK